MNVKNVLQCLCKNQRRMRASACENDSRKESGDRSGKGEDGVNGERADRWSALNIWCAFVSGKHSLDRFQVAISVFCIRFKI